MVKDKAYFKRYQVKFRRRRGNLIKEERTFLYRRKELIPWPTHRGKDGLLCEEEAGSSGQEQVQRSQIPSSGPVYQQRHCLSGKTQRCGSVCVSKRSLVCVFVR